MKQLFIFQRGGKLQKEENGYVKRTPRSSEINRTNLIRDWAKITDARKVKGIYRERLTAGGKGIIVKNRNEIFGTGVDVARSPSFIFQTVTKKGQMGCSNRRERERERDGEEDRVETKKPVGGTNLDSRLEIFRKLNTGTSHLWQIMAERTFQSAPYCIVKIVCSHVKIYQDCFLARKINKVGRRDFVAIQTDFYYSEVNPSQQN